MFSNHISNGNGAALTIKSKSAIIIEQSHFIHNQSKASGGVLFLSESMANINNSYFYNNIALRGSVINNVSDSYLLIKNSTFQYNGYKFN